MDNRSEMRYLDLWLWQSRFYKPLFLALLMADLILGLLLGGLLGQEGLAVLAGVPVIGLFWLVYGWVGLRMDRLRAGEDRSGAEVLDCLIVNGLFQSPGLAEIAGDRLILQPLFGKRIEVPLASIMALRRVRWFNGSLLIGKRGFILKVEGYSRLGLAIAASRAPLWQGRLVPPKA